MSYLDQAHDPRRRGKAIVAVATIHAALAYVVVTGLGAQIVERLKPPPLIGEQIPLPPPLPPDPTPPPPHPTVSKPVAPTPPIPLPPPTGPKVDPFDELANSSTSVFPTGPVAPPLPPAPPTPRFTPKRALPSNNVSRWITNDDYPRPALVDQAEGSVGYRLVIGTNGRVSSCELTRPSGVPSLDAATCRLITSRARFESATDDAGAKVLGTYTGSVTWQIPD